MSSRRRSAVAAGLLFLATVAASPVRAAVPANDQADGAIVVDALPAAITVDLTEATLDGDPAFCGSGSASVWYRYTPPSDQFLTISLAADPWMGAIHIAPDVPQGFQTCVFAGQSTEFFAESGRTYFLQVSTDGSPTSIELSAESPLANDRFADAETIAELPATVAADLTRTTSTGDPGQCSSTGNGAWYAFTPDTDTEIELSADANHSAIVTVTGSSSDDHIACLFSWGGPIRTDLQGGSTYHFLLSAGSPFGGPTSMSIVAVPPPPPPPANDEPADATVVGALPFEDEVDMTSASGDVIYGSFCFDASWPAVWYTFSPTSDVVVDADVSGGDGQARAAFFWGGDEEHVGGCTDHESAGTILARAGVVYTIGLAVPPWVDGQAGLRLTGSPAPTVALKLDPNGSVERVSGAAVISGTVTCSGTDLATVNIHLRQRVGRTGLISGDTGGQVRCGTTPMPWTMRVLDDDAPFGSGSVSVAWYAAYGDWNTRVEVTGESTVRLRGK